MKQINSECNTNLMANMACDDALDSLLEKTKTYNALAEFVLPRYENGNSIMSELDKEIKQKKRVLFETCGIDHGV